MRLTVWSQISADPKLSQLVAKMKDKEGDYFLKILNAQTGNESESC